ncbi:MAG TPA: copper ion binding protein [Acidimicrobiia bacterium]|nr:copper ion binding protein [Acidimicrobiia bacterium]
MNITLNVPGISCAHCKNTIEGAVGQLEGIDVVAVNIDQRTVAIDFDDAAVTLPEIVAALDEVGYEVVP